jgi:hypothetical protein
MAAVATALSPSPSPLLIVSPSSSEVTGSSEVLDSLDVVGTKPDLVPIVMVHGLLQSWVTFQVHLLIVAISHSSKTIV